MSELNFDALKDDTSRKMESSVEAFKKELAGLRSGRASTALLEPLMVNSYGSNVPISQVSSISSSDARMLSVSVWERSMVSVVEKAIRESNLGLNPITDGNVLRIPVPSLTEERRREFAKIAAQYAEEARIAIRNVRRDAMEKIKKDKQVSEDDARTFSDHIQKLTDKIIKVIDEVLKEKEKEIMQV